jgi:hypothetical protein
MDRLSAVTSSSARLGLSRLYGLSDYGSLPPRSRDEARATGASASAVRSTIDEYIQAGRSVRQAALLDDFAGKPLVVLTAGGGHDAAWAAAQDALATLSTDSTHRVVEGATHDSLISDERDAAGTTQAIVDVVSSVRTARPLAG